MFYDPKTQFTQVEFKRNEQGVYVHAGSPFFIDAEQVQSFGNGQINLESGASILVEEDAEQIHTKLKAKLQELEDYEAWVRELERTGMEDKGDGEGEGA